MRPRNFSYEQQYPHLFTPMDIRGVRFKNRIFMAPTGPCLGTDYNDTMGKAAFTYYSSFAKGGCGCVHIGESLLDRRNSSAHPGHLNIIDDEILKKLNTYNEYCHTFDARTSIEFNHSGHFAHPRHGDGVTPPMSCSAMTMPSGLKVREMNEEDMEYVAYIYAKAANMAKRAGFDMILLHYGHGWLMGGYLSPLLNKRKDKYGGSTENRMRFPLMVVKKIREIIGPDLLIEVRLSGEDCQDGGITIEDTIENVRMLQDYIDLVHISCGNRFVPVTRAIMHPSHFIEEGHNVHLAEAVKKAGVRIPVGTLGGIDNPDFAEKVLADGRADYILMARGNIADPDWANKARSGHADDIRPCIRCFHCLDIAGAKKNTSTHNLLDLYDEFPKSTSRSECSVNPLHGVGQCRIDFPPAERSKKVVVIGGGPAGMLAALTASQRGHEVVLFEKSPYLGGQLAYAKHVWFKKDMERYRAYLERQVRKADIDLRLSTAATPELVDVETPDAVIIAVGAEPLTPPVPGIKNPHVIAALDVFGHEDRLGSRVAIIGGGMVGCETALHLSSKGFKINLVEMQDILAPDGVYTERVHTMHFLENDANISIHTGSRCLEIAADHILVESRDGKKQSIPADSVILAAGMKSCSEEGRRFDGLAFDVITVGDCRKVGTIATATATAYSAALVL